MRSSREGVAPFAVSVPDSELDDLRARLAATRWPEGVPGSGWDYGTDVDWLRALCEYWADEFDWRAQEAVLNEWPQVLVRVGNRDVHCVHVPGVGPDPMPLVATHGWPSTFFEFHKIIGPVTDPAALRRRRCRRVPSWCRHSPATGSPTRRRVRFRCRAGGRRLGRAHGHARLRRFGSHGGDWGSAVTTALGARHPERMIGLHLTMAAPPVDPAALRPQRVWWDDLQQYRDREWGYVHLQRTKPQTPSFAFTDSPVGLAAWILEKWWRWSDFEDEHGSADLLRACTRDELLTTVIFYWVTARSARRCACTASRSGRGPRSAATAHRRPDRSLGVPATECTAAELVEPWYDLRHYTVTERGGHFPASRIPTRSVRELRDFFRPLRRGWTRGRPRPSPIRARPPRRRGARPAPSRRASPARRRS